MNQVLCSTGAIITKRNGRDYDLLREIVPETACDGLEFMMYQSWHDQTESLKKALSAFPVPVMHVTKQVGQWVSEGNMEDAVTMFRADCELAAAIGSKLLVLHLWSGQASDQHFERNMAAYPVLRDIAEGRGLLLTVENVICNTQEPMSRLRELADAYPDIAFTYDTKMAAFHSQLEALYQPENAWLIPHIAHMHINDYAGGHMDWSNMSARPLGQGCIDFKRFFAFVARMGYKGDFTYEGTALSEDGAVRYGELNESLGKIRRYAAEVIA